ncbi:hypothetical protein ACIBSW_23610 [Actinoplanes sp. NPDC049668]|uniref:hypothetical protein n=1 Tax=unclassified Actinoplanes TaxID=2626549 RepID=UPI0033AAE16F
MTRNRRIKGATREYQAATGVSYTAARRVVTGTDSAPAQSHTFAWIPPSAGHAITLQSAAAVAMEWAEKQAVRGLPVVLVTDRKGEYAHAAPFTRYAGRHITPRSSRLTVEPGAVIAHNPTYTALELAMTTAYEIPLAVVGLLPAPWWLDGWAAAVGALDLLTGEVTALDPRLAEPLESILFYGNNGYPQGWGRDGAQRALDEIRDAGLLDHDMIVSALAGLGMPAKHQEVISTMIDKMVPRGTGRDRMRTLHVRHPSIRTLPAEA